MLDILLQAYPPVDEAFRTGELLMGSEPLAAAADSAVLWSHNPINAALAVLSALLLSLNLRSVYSIAPHMWKGIGRWRWHYTTEGSIQLARTRDTVALMCVMPVALVADRYSLLSPSWLSWLPAKWSVLGALGIMIAFELLRLIPFLAISARIRRVQDFRIARKCGLSFFVVFAALLLSMVGIMNVFHLPDETIRRAAYIAALVTYLIMLLRKTQILNSFCYPLSTFLYLCALEFIPAGILIYSCLI